MKKILLNLFVSVIFLCGCYFPVDEATKKEIIDVFSKFNNYENVALLKDSYIFLHDKKLKIEKVNDETVSLIGCNENGVYAFTDAYDKLDIIQFDFDGNYTYLVEDYYIDNRVRAFYLFENKIYLSYKYNSQKYFLIFDINTLTFDKIKSDMILRDYIYSFYVYDYNMTKDKIIVTRKYDGVSRCINDELLSTIDEGKYILSLPRKSINDLDYTMIQMDEKIYFFIEINVSASIENIGLASTICAIFEYDFENNYIDYLSYIYIDYYFQYSSLFVW